LAAKNYRSFYRLSGTTGMASTRGDDFEEVVQTGGTICACGASLNDRAAPTERQFDFNGEGVINSGRTIFSFEIDSIRAADLKLCMAATL